MQSVLIPQTNVDNAVCTNLLNSIVWKFTYKIFNVNFHAGYKNDSIKLEPNCVTREKIYYVQENMCNMHNICTQPKYEREKAYKC